jgi:hypothetical protein
MRSEPGAVATGFFKRLRDKGERIKRKAGAFFLSFRLLILNLRNPVTTVPGSDSIAVLEANY